MPEESKPTKNAAKSGNRALPLLLAAIVLTAIGGWFWLAGSGENKAQAHEGSAVKSTLHLETFVMNLADSDQRSYLRVGIDLGVNHEAKHGEEVPLARVRDTILGVLALAKVDDLLTAAGKDKLKQDLQHALQERIPELGVEEVYFTEFLIQR
jgi:flagellar basal body-associated protein FliL